VDADCENENSGVVLFAVSLFAVATVKLVHSNHLPMLDFRVFFAGDGENTFKKIKISFILNHKTAPKKTGKIHTLGNGALPH